MMHINESIREHFKKLSRGLMQPNYAVAYEAHKKLYEIGRPVIPFLNEKILEERNNGSIEGTQI